MSSRIISDNYGYDIKQVHGVGLHYNITKIFSNIVRMPYYLIKLKLKKKKYEEVRFYTDTDLEKVYTIIEIKSRTRFGREVEDYDCSQISRRHPAAKRFLANKGRNIDSLDDPDRA